MTRVAQAAGMREALRALDCIMGSAGGICPLYMTHMVPRGGRLEERAWHTGLSVRSADRLVRTVRSYDEEWSTEILMGAPQRTISNEPTIYDLPMLWCRIEGKEQLRRARWLKPLPSIVLTEGSSTRKLLIWWVRPVDYLEVSDLNRRLAYKVGATQKHGLPENLRIPLPGSCLRKDRAKPVPIVVSRCRPDIYDAGQVAGKLRLPPEVKPGDWRRASNK